MTKIKYRNNFRDIDSHNLGVLDKEATVHVSTSNVTQNRCKKQGNLCHVNITWSTYTSNVGTSVAIATLPEEFRPKTNKILEGGICKRASESFKRGLIISIHTDGQIFQQLTGGYLNIMCVDLVYTLDE